MSLRNKFIKSELSESEEKEYLDNLYDKHYDKKLKDKYSEKLQEDYGLSRNIISEKKDKPIFTIYKSLAYLGSLAAMVLLFLVVKPLFNVSQSPSELALTYIQDNHFANQGIKRGENSSDLTRQNAILAYNKKDYDTAISLYSNLETKTAEDNYFLGLSHMYRSEYGAAIKYLSGIQESNDFKFQQEKNWFLSLCLIQNKEFDQAKILLKSIEGWNSSQIADLLSILENN